MIDDLTVNRKNYFITFDAPKCLPSGCKLIYSAVKLMIKVKE
jgi:hypothetical protein